MNHKVFYWLGLAAIAPLSGLINIGTSLAADLSLTSQSSSSNETQVAQLLYPPADARTQGVSVMGHGMASASADTAKIQLFFVATQSPDTIPDPFPPTTESNNTLTPEQLQPVVDALVASGVSADAIDLGSSSAQTFIFFNIQGQQMTILLTDPTAARVQELINLAQDTSADTNFLTIANISVQYFVDDCQGLANQAYTAAIADAQSRANAIATPLNVELEAIPSVAESPFSLLTFTPGSTCDASPVMSLPFNINLAQPSYNLSIPAEVELRRDLFVTFPIRN